MLCREKLRNQIEEYDIYPCLARLQRAGDGSA